jgi:polar amino acid transport system substrate-binding protein
MKFVALFAAMVAWSQTSTSAADQQQVQRQLAPTGVLRIGVAYAPNATPLFVARDDDGTPHGVPVDLGLTLAGRLGLPHHFVVMATTGELTRACADGAIDIGFIVIDEQRRTLIDFATPYFIIESTYLATGPSAIRSLAEIDRPEVTVVGIDGSTTFRAAGRSLTQARLVAAQSVAEAMDMLTMGQAQALALSRDAMPALRQQLPGARIIDGAFQVTGVAIGLAKGKAESLAYLNDFTEGMIRNGGLRQAFDRSGLQDLAIAGQ